MDVITGFEVGLFAGYLFGLLKAWSMKAFVAIFVLMVSFAIMGIIAHETAVSSGIASEYVYGWADLAMIIGTVLGMSAGKVTFEELKNRKVK